MNSKTKGKISLFVRLLVCLIVKMCSNEPINIDEGLEAAPNAPYLSFKPLLDFDKKPSGPQKTKKSCHFPWTNQKPKLKATLGCTNPKNSEDVRSFCTYVSKPFELDIEEMKKEDECDN